MIMSIYHRGTESIEFFATDGPMNVSLYRNRMNQIFAGRNVSYLNGDNDHSVHYYPIPLCSPCLCVD